MISLDHGVLVDSGPPSYINAVTAPVNPEGAEVVAVKYSRRICRGLYLSNRITDHRPVVRKKDVIKDILDMIV